MFARKVLSFVIVITCLFTPTVSTPTPTPPSYTPPRFLQVHPGDSLKSHVHWREVHLAWREQHGVDAILQTPQSSFAEIKKFAPHLFLGFDRSGNVIFLQRPGLIDFKSLQKSDISSAALLSHFIFTLEYCWRILDPFRPSTSPTPTGLMTSLIDLHSLSPLVALHPEKFDFLTKFVQTLSQHYPQRSYLTIIVNAPSWFNKIYKLIQPMLRVKTREKVRIIGNIVGDGKAVERNREELRELIGRDVDVEFLFTKGGVAKKGPIEEEFERFASKLKQEEEVK
ncbi:hypothetical protein TrVE_jg5035 [Triparma verrucosa]|uniref:CRAL-TRIO domain-containing protein n=1 Tax=Triparma verrucosa TaxID=1606542 RepID=A0A9W7EV00_9STRA|nr:hypothetical protein TrVE_jg5035 [Triparma verrucosa]